jgi:hypothetical protein
VTDFVTDREQRVRRHWQMLLKITITVAFKKDHIVSLNHGEGCSGDLPILQCLIHKLIEIAEAGFGHGSRCSCVGLTRAELETSLWCNATPIRLANDEEPFRAPLSTLRRSPKQQSGVDL